MSWTRKPLSDVAGFCLGKMLDEQKNRGESLPYLANVNVRWGEFDLTELRLMRFEPDEMERYGLKHGDIVMCEGGEPGRCAIWKDSVPGMMIQKALHRIRPHDCLDYRFLYYSFLHLGRTGGFAPLFTGATIRHLPRQQLAKLVIEVPPRPVQAHIAAILSAYDDLIENNRRRIALLEQAARLLYEEWFIHLRFPGREHTRIIAGVPKGWKRVTVGDVTTFLKRGIAPQYDDDADGRVINQKCVRDGRLNVELARNQSREFGPDRQVQVGDVLVNSTGEGTLGRVAQVKAPVVNCTVDTHVTIVRPSPNAGLHYFGAALLACESRLSTMGRGATNQTELSPSQIAAIEIHLPPHTMMAEFESFAGPVYGQVTNLLAQNQQASAARDLLLPHLMSGEIAV